MIVDMHTHLWQTPEQLGPQISEQLRRRFAERYEMLDAGPVTHEQAMEPVDVAVVLGFRSRYLGADVPNAYLAEYVARRKGKLIGFAGVDPVDADCLSQVRDWVSMGFSGLTISPAGQDYHPSDTRAMKLYELAQEMGLPVLLHQGTHFTRDSKMEYARPFLFDEIARTFPKLKLIIAHCGHPWIDETLALIGKHRNVWAELSNVIARPWQLYNVLLQAHQLEVTDRLLFGSDFPYNSPAQAISTMYSLHRFVVGTGLPTVPREVVRQIVERDALAELGILPCAPGSKTPAPASAKPQTVPAPGSGNTHKLKETQE